LPEADLRAMREPLKAALTEGGWALCDLQGLELAALGRAAVWNVTTSEAATATVTDYLACAWTIGEVRPERLADMRQALATGTPPAVALETGEAERKALVAARQEAQRLREREALELIGTRAAAAALCHNAAREQDRLVPRSYRQHALAAGLAAQLRFLAEKIGEARSRKRLEALEAEVRAAVGNAHQLLGEVEAERAWEAQQAAIEQAQETAWKLDERRRRALASGRRPFDALSGETPTMYLERLGFVNLAVEQELPAPGAWAGALGAWLHPNRFHPPTLRAVRRWYWCGLLGRNLDSSQLARWSSPAVRAIGAALAASPLPAPLAGTQALPR
jgi:hypothetical protein